MVAREKKGEVKPNPTMPLLIYSVSWYKGNADLIVKHQPM